MSKVPPNQKNDIESVKNQILQEVDQRILEIVPSLIDASTISQKVRAVPDTEPDEIIVNGIDLLFLKNKEYVESEPVEGSGYPEFGEVLKTDGQGNYTIKVGCKIVDDEESSEYWEIEYSIVELT
jgi:hypothetical protein